MPKRPGKKRRVPKKKPKAKKTVKGAQKKPRKKPVPKYKRRADRAIKEMRKELRLIKNNEVEAAARGNAKGLAKALRARVALTKKIIGRIDQGVKEGLARDRITKLDIQTMKFMRKAQENWREEIKGAEMRLTMMKLGAPEKTARESESKRIRITPGQLKRRIETEKKEK